MTMDAKQEKGETGWSNKQHSEFETFAPMVYETQSIPMENSQNKVYDTGCRNKVRLSMNGNRVWNQLSQP